MRTSYIVLSFFLLLFSEVRASNPNQHCNPELLATYLLFAGNSYCKNETIQSWTCPGCSDASTSFSDIQLFMNSTTNMLAYVGVNNATSKENSEILVIFRGTIPRDLEIWIASFSPEVII